MIPVLIVPVLTDAARLFAMLDSIDYPVKTLVVIDNGAPVSSTKLTALNRQHIGRRYLWRMPSNLGVATSWNLGIKATPFAPWWLVANYDLTWPPGVLERFAAASSPERVAVSGEAAQWCAFTIGEQVIKRVGLFDEGIHPAYWEDLDYERRCTAQGVTITRTGLPVGHRNSSTIAAGYADRNRVTFATNAARANQRANAGDLTSGEWSLTTRRALSWD
jgi:GT2 family glycosyltransferase